MISGFRHGNRGVGIRHHQLILPSVVCSTHVARRIATEVGAVTFAHQHGCGIIGEDVQGIDDFFADLADHPNVSSVLIVGLGCETIQGQELGARLSSKNESTKYQIIQESGGIEGTVMAGVIGAQSLIQRHPIIREEISSLTVGLDLSQEDNFSRELESTLKNLGMQVITMTHSGSSIDNFSHLMCEKAHVIISFPEANQPASGFPLIPVLNVSNTSPLHMATQADFDISHQDDIGTFVDILVATSQGALTKSEINGVGEIRAPRFVRSV